MGRRKEDLRNAEKLWTEFGPEIQRTLSSYESDYHLREDLGQNIFLAILSSVHRVASVSNKKAYVLRIAHNVAVDHIANQSRSRWSDLPADIPDTGCNPETNIGSDNNRARLQQAIRRLALPYRQVLALLMEDLDYSEIADVLGISAGTVRVRVTRAKERLRGMLGHD